MRNLHLKQTLTVACIHLKRSPQAVCRPFSDQLRPLSPLRYGPLRSALTALLLAPLAALHAAEPPTAVNEILSQVDAKLIADVEADARAYLDARAATRVGPVLFDIERFTKVQEDGSVLVSNYWGRAPMLGYLFFDGFDLLGEEKYRRVALDLADHYLRIQELEGFWHYAHFVKPDGTTSRLEMAEAKGRAVCRIQDAHQSGILNLLLYAWRVTDEKKYFDAAKRCGDYLLSIQNENGSWPDYWIPGHQHSEPNPRQKAGAISGGSYNDGATSGGLGIMLTMYHLTGDTKYLARIPALGQWIFDTQLGEGKVRGWCQQYDLRNKPTAARHFESPVIDPRTFPRFIVPLCAWFVAMSGEERYITVLRETVDWVRSVEKPGPDGGWGYQYLPDGTAVFSLDYKVYRHDQPETWPKEFPEKHDGIQRYTRSNGGPGDAPYFIAAFDKGGMAAIRAMFGGSTKLTPDEYLRERLAAAKFVSDPKHLAMVRARPLREANPKFELDRSDNEKAPGRVEWEWLHKLRIAQGRFTPEQLATGGQPRFCGDRTHSVKIANWFEIPWSELPVAKPSQGKEPVK